MLKNQGIEIVSDDVALGTIFDVLELNEFTTVDFEPTYRDMQLRPALTTDVSLTPFYYGPLEFHGAMEETTNDLTFKMKGIILVVTGPSQVPQEIDLHQWLNQQTDDIITQPNLDFSYAGENYRAIIESIYLAKNDLGEWGMTSLAMALFSAHPPADDLPPVNLTSQ